MSETKIGIFLGLGKKLMWIVLGFLAGIGFSLSPIVLYALVLTFIDSPYRTPGLSCSFGYAFTSLFFVAPFLLVSVLGSVPWHIMTFLENEKLTLWNKVFIVFGVVLVFIFIFQSGSCKADG